MHVARNTGIRVHTIAIISQKGGAGKTTLAIHLAAASTLSGLESVVLDADPQATASSWSHWRELAGLGAPEVIDCASPTLLPKKLAAAADLGAEIAIIDTPPHSDIMAREACRAAGLVLIPCRPQAFDLAAVEMTAELAKASGKPAFVIWVGGPTRAPTTYREATELVERLGLPVAPAMMTQRAIYHHSTGAGRVAVEIEPDGKAATETRDVWTWARSQVGVATRKRVSKRRVGA